MRGMREEIAARIMYCTQSILDMLQHIGKGVKLLWGVGGILWGRWGV